MEKEVLKEVLNGIQILLFSMEYISSGYLLQNLGLMQKYSDMTLLPRVSYVN